MRKDFVNEVAKIQNIKRTDLIEKDLILHQVLFDLSKNKFFHNNFAYHYSGWISPAKINAIADLERFYIWGFFYVDRRIKLETPCCNVCESAENFNCSAKAAVGCKMKESQ